jgi:hypothetical protein
MVEPIRLDWLAIMRRISGYFYIQEGKVMLGEKTILKLTAYNKKRIEIVYEDILEYIAIPEGTEIRMKDGSQILVRNRYANKNDKLRPIRDMIDKKLGLKPVYVSQHIRGWLNR